MLYLSELMIQNPQLESFDQLMELVQQAARSSGEIHLKIDIKPNYGDTPGNWEDRLEGAFSGVHSVTWQPGCLPEDD